MKGIKDFKFIMNVKSVSDHKIAKAGFVLVPVLLVAVGLAVFSILPKSSAVNIEGSVEISTSPYFSQVNGTVAELSAETGETVRTGDVLAVIDSEGIDNEIEQLKATLTIKNARLKELAKDPKVGAVDAARKSAQDNADVCRERLASAERELTDARRDLETQSKLFESGSISKQELNGYGAAVEGKLSAVSIARAQLAAAQSNVNTIEYPEKSAGDIEAAQADVRLTELQIEKLENSRDDYVIKAQKDGVVVSRSIDAGSTVTAGQSIFELSNENDKYFVFYLPEEYVKGVAYGDELGLYRLNSDETIGTGRICYIDWKAIYTPKDFETGANKNKRSVKIKALIQSEVELSIGETVVTRIQNEE